MELILISSSKLKVMLSRHDMDSYALDCDTMDYDNTETRRAFWQILDEAKQQTGFDAASERVFVQVYPSREGGCEMYVTKLSAYSDREAGQGRSVSVRVKRPSAGRTGRSLYCFSELEDLLRVCRQIEKSGFADESAVYTDEAGRWYLVLNDISAEGGRREASQYPFIAEYATRRTGASIEPFLSEYCRAVAVSDAVRTFAGLAV